MRGLIRWCRRIIIILSIAAVGWIALDSLVRPVSTLMLGRWVLGKPVDRRWTPLSEISPKLVATVVLSEDGQFCRHHGVDWEALRTVLGRGKRPSRGASTLTMQVAKNLFLWPGRSYVRKALEIPLALVLDAIWTKKRILEIYFNIAEWGDGVFGAEAAAEHDFKVPAKNLSLRQAALLATALPNPFLRKPDQPTRLYGALADRIAGLAPDAPSHVSCID